MNLAFQADQPAENFKRRLIRLSAFRKLFAIKLNNGEALLRYENAYIKRVCLRRIPALPRMRFSFRLCSIDSIYRYQSIRYVFSVYFLQMPRPTSAKGIDLN